MADRPLRPATDRRLGRPLPHQLANPPQAPPEALESFGPKTVCGISSSFEELSPTSGQVPTCYSPVRHCPPPEGGFSCDLHALGTPPTFILSQDQSLQNNQTISSRLANRSIRDKFRFSVAVHKHRRRAHANVRRHRNPEDPSETEILCLWILPAVQM